MELDVQPGATHTRRAADTALSVPIVDGPRAVAVLVDEGWVFWLQPEEWTSYGRHGAPGKLIGTELDEDGKFRLQGMCDAWCEVDDTYYDKPLPSKRTVAAIESLLRRVEKAPPCLPGCPGPDVYEGEVSGCGHPTARSGCVYRP